jgi:hypothetical protein
MGGGGFIVRVRVSEKLYIPYIPYMESLISMV